MHTKTIYIILAIVVIGLLAYYLINNSFFTNQLPESDNNTTTDDIQADSPTTSGANINETTKQPTADNIVDDNEANEFNYVNPFKDYSEVCSSLGTKAINWAIFSNSHFAGTKTVVAGLPTIITQSNHKIEFRQDVLPAGTKIYYCTAEPRFDLPTIGDPIALKIENFDRNDQIPFTITTNGVPVESSERMECIYDLVQFDHLKSGKESIGFGWSQPKNGISQKTGFYDPSTIWAVINVEDMGPLLFNYIEYPQM